MLHRGPMQLPACALPRISNASLSCRSVHRRLLLCIWVTSAMYMVFEQQRVLLLSSNHWLAAMAKHAQAWAGLPALH